MEEALLRERFSGHVAYIYLQEFFISSFDIINFLSISLLTHHIYYRLPSRDEENLYLPQHHFLSLILTSNRELVSDKALNHTSACLGVPSPAKIHRKQKYWYLVTNQQREMLEDKNLDC